MITKINAILISSRNLVTTPIHVGILGIEDTMYQICLIEYAIRNAIEIDSMLVQNSVHGAVDQVQTYTECTVGYFKAEWSVWPDPDHHTSLRSK